MTTQAAGSRKFATPVHSIMRMDAWSTRSPDERAVDADSWVLLCAARDGDRGALDMLYRLHFARVYRYISGRVRHRHIAEELTSDVFVRVIRAVSSVRIEQGKFAAWLTTISRNIVLDYFKSRHSQMEVPVGAVPDRGAYVVSAEHQALSLQVSDETMECLGKLAPDQRNCLTLRFFEEKSITETAAAMDRSLVAIRQLQYRGIQKMASMLAAHDAPNHSNDNF